MKYFASLIALAFCLFIGCSKETSNEAETKAPATTLDLGVIEVADRVKMLFALGGDKTCTIRPTFLQEGTVLLEMIVEQNGHILSRPRIQTPFDMPVSISDGTTTIAFTAHKKI